MSTTAGTPKTTAPSLCCPGAAAEDALCVELVRRQLTTSRVGFQMLLYQEIDSTNSVLRRVAESGAPEGVVVLAETQSAGRGRLGQKWFSPPRVNLYASVLFRPRIAPAAAPPFSFIASLALTDAIAAEGIAASIKWPNDVLVGGRKAAGTFVMCATQAGRVEHLILGVGVNVNVARATLAGALGEAARDATSLCETTGRRIDRNAFAAAFLNGLQRWADVYAERGPDPVLQAWRERDALAGRRVLVRAAGATYRGRAVGVDSDGKLRVQDAAGVVTSIVGGQVVLEESDHGDRDPGSGR